MIHLQKTLSIALLCCLPFLAWTQATNGSNNKVVWTDVAEAGIPAVGTRYITPTEYRTVRLDVDLLRTILDQAPMEFSPIAQMTQTHLTLPMPDGTLETFDIQESPIMAAELAEKFPMIKTYNGVSTSDAGKYVRFDLTPAGFHAMILVAGGNTIFIDPYTFGGGDIQHYIVYQKKNFKTPFNKVFSCGTEYDEAASHRNHAHINAKGIAKAFGSCQLREYRLALSCTGEYATFHGGTVAGALAAMVVSVNRVNSVYERDMAIRMNLIANNNVLVFTNASTDPFTNNSGGAMLGQNQTTVDNAIGNANYDIGHVFSTGGGGIAGAIGNVCRTGQKAEGVTGSPSPVGDPFDIDYVAHEMGHQFGANHTQNNSSCANPPVNVEPGSASTIMGYAGICAPNVQNNSDDYFNAANLQEIGAYITTGQGGCPTAQTLTNNAPTITTTAATYTIPASTPFALTAISTDLDTADVLTYTWEQRDAQTSTQPPVATSTVGPNFRSLNPSTNPTRYFPNLTDLSAGVSPTWEVLSSVNRTMNFRGVVRDNSPGAGCNEHVDVTVTVAASAGPFVVTYPSATGISWIGTTTQNVTWNVANTDVAPVNSPTVDIFLSTDGGMTYPTVVATNVTNDGAQQIVVPNTPSTTCRIMIKSSNGLFFDISDNNFEITAATFGYTMTAQNPQVAVCPTSNGVFNIQIGSILGYTDSVALSVTGVPAGAVATFANNPVAPLDSTTLTISNLSGLAAGTYTMTLNGNSTSGPRSQTIDLIIYDSALPAATLATPADGAGGVALPATFTWNAASSSGVTYAIDIATDAAFTAIVDNATGLTTTSYVSNALVSNTTYYWRVIANNPCSTAPASATFSFATPLCSTIASTNVPVTISATGTPTITSTLNVPTSGNIVDLNVLNLAGTHTWINDLTVSLTSPGGTTRILWDQICGNENDFNVNFDDAASSNTLPCPPTGGGTYQPQQTLAGFNGQAAAGNWTLTIVDNANQDGGALNTWSLDVCVAVPTIAVDAGLSSVNNLSGTYCNVTSFNPEITLVNDGINTITSADIVYNVDGGANSTFNWTGSLASSATTNVTLPTITVSGGVHTFNATVTNPNGGSDGNASNDVTSSSFNVVSNGQNITVAITTDAWGSETTWDITDGASLTVASGGPYPDGTPNITYTDLACLPVGCYTYTIYDSYGDGIQDGTNTGNYVLTDTSGTTLVQMTVANFGNSTSHSFCITGPTAVEEIPSIQNFSIMPNPNQGQFTVAIDLGADQDANVSVVNVLGQSLRNYQFNQANFSFQVEMNEFASGVYFVVLKTQNGIVTRKVTISK